MEIAVCDLNENYCRRFVSYLMKYKSEEFLIHMVSSQEILQKKLYERTLDAVLLGQGFEELEIMGAERKIPFLILQEEKTDGENEIQENGNDITVIKMFRYQPMEKIIHNLYVLAGRKSGHIEKNRIMRQHLEIIGVCSPIFHEMQMPFSMVMCSVLSKQKKVLYLNLMEYSGFMELFGLDGCRDFGDVVLKLRANRLHVQNFRQNVHEFQGFFYIIPFLSPENLHEVTMDDMKDFFSFLEEETDFEAVIMDLGNGAAGFFGLLECCTSSYCLTRQGYFFECRINEFLDCLNRKNKNAMPETLHVLELPFLAKYLKRSSSVYQQLIWSEFGDYVRAYLAGREGNHAGGCD